MKPRIEKKLSKKLAKILKNVRGFTPNNVWIDKWYSNEACDIHWAHNNPNGLTPKQKRQNWQRTSVRVNNMPSVGGELDYWGEGTDWRSVFREAQEMLLWEMFYPTPNTPEDDPEDMSWFDWPNSKGPLTGKRVIELAYRYANGERKEAA